MSEKFLELRKLTVKYLRINSDEFSSDFIDKIIDTNNFTELEELFNLNDYQDDLSECLNQFFKQ